MEVAHCLTAAVLGLASFSAMVHGGDYTYMTYNGTILLTKYTGPGGDVEVPSTIDGLPVVNLGNAFSRCATVTSVTIPNSVTDIRHAAFISCPVLTNVTIPSNVTSIGESAFFDCAKLASVTLPNSLTNIGFEAFYGCFSLTSVTIPANVAFVGVKAFGKCQNLQAITVEPANPAYRSEAGVLYNREQTRLIQYPPGKSGSCAIPGTVTSIQDMAFYYCGGLTNVSMPASVTNIGDYAFQNCDRLASLTIPAGVIRIGYNTLLACASLMAFTVDSQNPHYSSTDGVLYNQGQTTLLQYPMGRVGTWTMPDTVTRIGYSAFAYCTNLMAVTIPGSVTNIGSRAFMACNSLASVALPDSVATIDGGAFQLCFGLTNVTIGKGATYIGPAAFASCTSLGAITVAAQNPNYSSVDGVLFDKGQTRLIQFPGGKSGDYIVPGTVTTIGYAAFARCNRLTGVSMGKNVDSLEADAFISCSGLMGAYFEGDAPGVDMYDGPSFQGATNVTVYYLPGTLYWGVTFGGRPTALWVRPAPLIITTARSFGIRAHGFGFNVAWVTNVPVIVEASTSLSNPVWIPLKTNTLVGGWFYFYDPKWTNYLSRYYRIRSY